MKTALVTGSQGFVGHYLVKALTDDGYYVYPFDLRQGGADVRDYELVRSAIDAADPDLIFHLAAVPYVPESTSDVRRGINVNVLGTLNVLEAIRHSGSNARLLVSGTSEEYGYDTQGELVDEDTVPRPQTPYGASKLAAGQLALVYSRLYGIPVVVTRACNHTGPGHSRAYAVPSFAKRVAAVEKGLMPAVRHGNLDSVRSYLDVRDVVEAYLLAIDLPSGIYNISSRNRFSMGSVLAALITHATGDIPIERDDSLYRPGNTHYPQISSDKFRNITGWEPKISLDETLRDTLNYWRERI